MFPGRTKEAEKCFSAAADYGQLNDDSTITSYAKYHLSLIKLYNKDFAVADSMFRSLVNDKWLYPFYRIEVLFQLSKIASFHKADYSESLSLADKCIEKNNKHGAAYNIKGINYLNLEKYDSAYFCLKKSLSCNNDLYTEYSDYTRLSALFLQCNDPDSANYYSILADSLINHIYSLNNNEEITTNLILQSVNEIRHNIRKHRVLHLVSSILTLVLLIIVSLYLKNRKTKNVQASTEDLDMVAILEKNDNQHSEAAILDYCYKRFKTTKSSVIINEREMALDSELNKNLLYDLDVSFSYYYSYLANKYNGINTLYFHYCILSYLRLSKNRIVDILCISDVNYRVIKNRLKNLFGSDSIITSFL